MAVENYNTFTALGAVTLMSPIQAVFTDMTNTGQSDLYKDFGADYFSGDFIHTFRFRIQATETYVWMNLWAMANFPSVSYAYLRDHARDGLFLSYSRTLSNLSLRLWELNTGTPAATGGLNFNAGVTYYVKLVRTESVGTYGHLYLYVYTDAAMTSLLGSLDLGLSKKTDFQYLYQIMEYGELFDGSYNNKITGYTMYLSGITDSSPDVTTQAVSAIDKTTATGNGTVTDLGTPAATQHGHKWDTNSAPYSSATYSELGVPTLGAFTSSLTGLTPYRTYWVVSYITSSYGTSYGTVVSFMTLPSSDPNITTESCTDVTSSTATGNGTVVSVGDNAITEHGHCWATHHLPTTADDLNTNGAHGAGAFTSSIITLLVNTVYYVRSYATTSAGTFYGNEIKLTTGANLPIVTTQEVTNVAEIKATGNLTLVNTGGSALVQYGVVWDTSTHTDPGNVLPANSDYTAYTAEGTQTVMGKYTSDIIDLLPEVSYYVRAYATNATGTTYGVEVTFTTRIAGAPIVTTEKSQFVTRVTAQGEGTLVSIGQSAVTQHGHCWGTSANPTTSDSKTTLGAATPYSFESDIINLTPGDTYYTRAYATNTQGTGYGDNDTFVAQSGFYPYPMDRLGRVSGIVRTFWAGGGGQEGVYQTEIFQGGLSTNYISPIGSRETPSAASPLPSVSGPGYQPSDYAKWKSIHDPMEIIRIFGHPQPSYNEWVNYQKAQKVIGGRAW
uniref:Fibronectin type-III domain-containing protein n=1 Tax=viral metagenome TaxID=1070528 RepID=A0A6M3LCP9_9ZZZZ